MLFMYILCPQLRFINEDADLRSFARRDELLDIMEQSGCDRVLQVQLTCVCVYVCA